MDEVAEIKEAWEKLHGSIKFDPPYRSPIEKLLAKVERDSCRMVVLEAAIRGRDDLIAEQAAELRKGFFRRLLRRKP
jgi:hypothetical protein